MAFPVTQSFKRTTKGLRFEDDVLTKSQMLQATDDEYETGYAVIDKDTLEQYVYNANATPSQETGKFVKSSGTSGETPNIEQVLTKGDTAKNKRLKISNTSGEIFSYIIDNTIETTHRNNTTNVKNSTYLMPGIQTIEKYENNQKIEEFNINLTSQTPTVTMTDNVKTAFKTTLDIGGGSLPAGGTTGQALVKKSDADQDVEWADQTVIVGSDWGVAKQGTVTVSGTTESTVSISDLNLTSASDYQVAITPSANTSNPSYINKSVASFTVKIADNSGNKTLYYTIFAKGYGSVPNGGTTGQALIKKSNTDGDVEWKTVSGGGASLTIDTTQVGYGEATVSEGGQNLSFTNQNGQGVHIGGISENGEMVASKTYVDSKSPTIVNEGATFTNANGNQKMQIRTGGTNSVIIKDTNASGTTEYWSYELPDKDYVDTEIAKRNAVVNFDNEYKTLQIRDVSDSVEFQVVKETSNDYIKLNEYAEDDRGQMQQIFDVKLPTKEYVDNLSGGVQMEVGAEKWYGTYTENNVTYQTYTKIVYIPALPSTAGITTYPMGISNIKQILNIYGYTTDGFILNAPRQNVQDNISIYQVSKGSQTFSIEVGKDRSSKSAYVTIVYAKNNT